MNIHVVNRNSGVQGISIMRGKSAVANPFKNGSREERIQKFRHWLWAELQGDSGSPVNVEMRRLLGLARKGPLVLVCCCKPLPCHGDIVRAALEWLDKQ